MADISQVTDVRFFYALWFDKFTKTNSLITRCGKELDLDFNTGETWKSLISSTLMQREGRCDSATRCFLPNSNVVCNSLSISGGNKLDLDLYEGRKLVGCYAGGARRHKHNVELNNRR